MRKRVYALAFFLAAGLCAAAQSVSPGPSPAQTPAPRVLGLADCLSRAEAANRGLRAGSLKVVEDAARLEEARRAALPSLVLSGSYQRLSEVEAGSVTAHTAMGTSTIDLGTSPLDSTSFRASLSQPLYAGGRIRAGVAQAQSQRAASTADLERTRQVLAASVEEAFWNLAVADRSALLIAENLRSLQERLSDARNSYANGVASRGEVLRIQSQLAGVEALKAENEAAREGARTRLCLLLGYPWDEKLAVPPDALDAAVPGGEALPPLADLVGLARTRRPELAAASARSAAAGAALTVARSGLFPGAWFTADFLDANPNQRVFPQKSRFIPSWSIGVTVSLDAGRAPAVMAASDAAAARLAQARESFAQQSDAASQDAVAAYQACLSAAARRRAAEAALDLAQETAKDSRALYDNGMALSSDRLDAELGLLNAKLNAAKADAQARVEQSRLRLAVGGSW